jgi:hypothetical protein
MFISLCVFHKSSTNIETTCLFSRQPIVRRAWPETIEAQQPIGFSAENQHRRQRAILNPRKFSTSPAFQSWCVFDLVYALSISLCAFLTLCLWLLFIIDFRRKFNRRKTSMGTRTAASGVNGKIRRPIRLFSFRSNHHFVKSWHTQSIFAHHPLRSDFLVQMLIDWRSRRHCLSRLVSLQMQL